MTEGASGSAVEVRGLVKVYQGPQGGLRAVDAVDLTIRRNEFFTLLGPSGCGKTTLLRLIAGFEQPTAGEILLEGKPIADAPPHRRPVNTVFQSYALFPHLTVGQNIAFGLEMQRLPRAEIEGRIERMLNLVKLAGYGDRRPAQLSGGQQQRVALARALATAPRVLLLDEPLSALDLKLRKEMQIELKRLQHETGITFIFVTHDQEEALTMSDRVAVMRDGRVLQIGSPAEIYEHPVDRFVADFIGETNFLPATREGREGERTLFRLAAGSVLAVREPGSATRGQDIVLAVRPERAALREKDAGSLPARVETVVYSARTPPTISASTAGKASSCDSRTVRAPA